MTARDLEIFICVAECGQMSEAARQLVISQSSVSQSISNIEKEYGVLLFERLSKHLYLTDTGRELLRYARSALALTFEIEDFLRGESVMPRLKLGATITVGTCVISPLVRLLEEQMPKIQTEVCVENTHLLEEKLLKGELDVGLVEGTITNQNLVTEDAIDDELVLICSNSHPFYGCHRVDISELNGQNFILREPGSGTRAQLENQLKGKKIVWHVKWSCRSSEAIKNAVKDCHGISVISRRLVSREFEAGALWMCGVNGLDLSRRFSLVYHKDKYRSAPLDAFISICKEFGCRERSLALP